MFSTQPLAFSESLHDRPLGRVRARLVDELAIRREQDGNETAPWKDRYSVREARDKIAAFKKEMFLVGVGFV